MILPDMGGSIFYTRTRNGNSHQTCHQVCQATLVGFNTQELQYAPINFRLDRNLQQNTLPKLPRDHRFYFEGYTTVLIQPLFIRLGYWKHWSYLGWEYFSSGNSSLIKAYIESVTTPVCSLYFGNRLHGVGIGDLTCINNAKSEHLRCAVNPSGPCEGCMHYEKVNLSLQ